MSTSVLPTLKGLGWPINRTPNWKTSVQRSISGKRTAIQFQNVPIWEWELTYNYLKSDSVALDLQTLASFFNNLKGAFDTFLYTDADDNSVTAQPLGTGDGADPTWQLVRTMTGIGSSYVEPILAPNVVSAVYLAGASIPAAGLSAPTNGTLTSTAAGALGATTYYVKCTWVTKSGETLASTETTLAVAANRVLNVAAPGSAPVGAIGWNVYVGNTAGGGTGTEKKQNGSTPIALATPWVEPTSGLVAGAVVPLANTTGWSVSTWGTATPGVVTFAGAPGSTDASTPAITADFTYYWPVALTQDSLELSKFLQGFYKMPSLKFMQVI